MGAEYWRFRRCPNKTCCITLRTLAILAPISAAPLTARAAADKLAVPGYPVAVDVPDEKRHVIVMFHQRSADFDIVLSNDAFSAKYGKDNLNIELISALTKADVESANAHSNSMVSSTLRCPSITIRTRQGWHGFAYREDQRRCAH